MIFRNTMAVLAGLAIALTLILIGITLNKNWFDELSGIELTQKGDVFYYWQSVLKQAPTNFFIALHVSSGVGALVGGVVTAFLVKRAHEAYAMIIGMILFSLAVLNILIFKGHPTWYIIAQFFIYFPFSWLGGKIVAELIKKGIITQK